MKIAVCGCSWSSRDPAYPGYEFGQLLANYYNATEYRNYAVPGCSNFVIALQVEQAILEFDPDLIVINATTVTRDDFHIPQTVRYNHTQLLNNLDNTLYSNSLGSIFSEDLSVSLDDAYEAQSLRTVFTPNSHNKYKSWFVDFYDADIQKHKQYYILQSMLYKLQIIKKSFIFSPNTFEWTEGLDIKTSDTSKNFPEDPHVWDIPAENLMPNGISEYLFVDDEIYVKWENGPGTLMSNHLSPESHQLYAADLIGEINRSTLINKST